MERPSPRNTIAEVNSAVKALASTVEHDEAVMREAHLYLKESLLKAIQPNPMSQCDESKVILLLGAVQAIEWTAARVNVTLESSYRTDAPENVLKAWDKLDLWGTAVTSR